MRRFRFDVNGAGARIVPSFSVSWKVTVGFWPGAAFMTERIWAFRPLSWVARWGTVCAPCTEASQSWLPTGWWHEAHCAVVGLGAARVILAGREVDVVVTGLAGRPAGYVYQLVACVAGAAWHVAQLRMSFGKATSEKSTDGLLEADDLVGRSRLHAREVLALVDLVDHDLEVDRVARVRIGRLGRVAEDAELDVLPRAAVRGERVVARVACRLVDHVPGLRHRRRRSGTKSCSTLAIVVLVLDVGHVAGRVDAEGGRGRDVVAGRNRLAELVRRVAEVDVGEGPARVRAGLRRPWRRVIGLVWTRVV